MDEIVQINVIMCIKIKLMTHVKNKIKDQDKDTLPLIKSNLSSLHNQYYSTGANKNETGDKDYDNQIDKSSNELIKFYSKHSNRIGGTVVYQSEENVHEKKLEEDSGLIQKKSHLRYKKHQNLSKSRQLQGTIKQKRFVKSVMELHDYDTSLNPSMNLFISPTHKMGKYRSQVMSKFDETSTQDLSDEGIIKLSDEIKELIRKYNDVLTQMINKSIREFTTKKKLKQPVEDSIKIVQEQIKNNCKIQNFGNTEFKKLTDFMAKLEQQENYNVVDMEEEIRSLHIKIHNAQKQIQVIKTVVESESKKFMVNDFLAIKPDIHPQMSLVKEKLLKGKKEWQRNEQRIAGLQKQQRSLQLKLSNIQPKQREAVEIIQNDKVNQYKNKKLEDGKRRLQVLKAHMSKVQSLFNAKSNLIIYENENFKQKIKSFDLQMSNLEGSIKKQFQRTFQLLTSCTPKNQGTKKILDRILEEMTSNQKDSTFNKTQNLEIMQELVAKRNSYDNHIFKLADKKKPINLKKNQNGQKPTKNKTKSQQSERNRIWKLEDIEAKQHIPKEINIRVSLPNKNQSLLRNSQDNDKNYLLEPKRQTNPYKFKVSQSQQAGADEQQENEFIL